MKISILFSISLLLLLLIQSNETRQSNEEIVEAFSKCMKPKKYGRKIEVPRVLKYKKCLEHPLTRFLDVINYRTGIKMERSFYCDKAGKWQKRDQIKDAIDFSHLKNRIFGLPTRDNGDLLAKWSRKSRVNPEEISSYAEGDILIPSNKRSGVIQPSKKWEQGTVPYVIATSFKFKDRFRICDVMALYHQKTCIKFVPKTPEHTDYLLITNKHSGCFAGIGHYAEQNQLNLQTPNCLQRRGTIIHELMHILGIMHEQARADRDKNVKIVRENIEQDKLNNFEKKDKKKFDDYGVKYDYHSVMHYSSYAFSKNSEPTILTKDRDAQNIIGQRKDFSKMDLIKIRRMYNCPEP